jgi:hypothetical protein
LKKIVTHFNHSLVARDELTKIQKERLNQPALFVIQDCPTRWNSTFYMMERFAKLKDSLVLYLSANPIAMISPEDWINVQKFVQIMQPFEEITRNLSNSQVSISSVIPLIEVLMTTLQQEETKPDTSEQFQNFTRKLRDELNSSTRFGDLMKDDKYTIATYLVTEQVESKTLNLIMIRTKDTNANQEDDCRPSTPSSPKRARIQIEPSTSCALQTLESLLNTNEDQLDPTTTDDNSDNLLSFFIVFILPLPHLLLFPLLQKFTFDICFRFCFCYDTSVASLLAR